MNAKIGSTGKLAAVRTELGQALGSYAGRLSFGLVAFGHRKASNCADSEILAKPGELTFASQSKLLDKIKPKGQAPIAAALSDAAKAAQTQGRFDIVLIADGGDTCDADICSTAVALKEKSQSLRIHVIGFNDKPDELKPLTCVAGATGGTFVAATNAAELKQGLATVLDAIVTPGAPAGQVVAAEGTAALPAMASPCRQGWPPPSPSISMQRPPRRATGRADPGGSRKRASRPQPQSAAKPSQAAPAQARNQPAKRRCTIRIASSRRDHRSPGPHLPPRRKRLPSIVQSVPIAPPRPRPAKIAAAPAPQIQLPVLRTFKALITEAGPKLQTGLTWRVYASKTSPEGGGYKPQHASRGDADSGIASRRISRKCGLRPLQPHQEDQGRERAVA
jgi:hypothetical protein